eukprot:scaffold112302_cov67-Phaeocystis_antarctica.AAC.1
MARTLARAIAVAVAAAPPPRVKLARGEAPGLRAGRDAISRLRRCHLGCISGRRAAGATSFVREPSPQRPT